VCHVACTDRTRMTVDACGLSSTPDEPGDVVRAPQHGGTEADTGHAKRSDQSVRGSSGFRIRLSFLRWVWSGRRRYLARSVSWA
jgi:hypothetical protein